MEFLKNLWTKVSGIPAAIKGSVGKKVIMGVAAFGLDALRAKYDIAWLDREFILIVLSMLLAGHTVTDIVHLITSRKLPPAPL